MTPEAAFLASIQNGDSEEVLRRLAEDRTLAGARDEAGFTALTHAIYAGNQAVVDAILAQGPETDLFEASAAGLTERVGDLLSAGADLYGYSPDGWTPLHLAVFFGHPDTAAALIDEGADIHAVSRNTMDVTPLQSALARGHVDSAKLLLEHGAHVNGEPSGSWAPLHYCAAQGLTEMAEKLLNRGADPHRTQGTGKTPLQMAEAAGHTEVAEVLRTHSGT